MKHVRKLCVNLVWILTLLPLMVQGQTTGKIAGMVTDASTGEPLAGANVVLENTTMGAAVGLDGTFYIINVPPGKYDLTVSMMGYDSKRVENLDVSVNRTVNLDITLKPAIMEGEVIVVQADKISEKKDQTSSLRTVSSDQIEALPIENVTEVVAMQAGVVDGHFRGGRSDEVAYMVDGMPVDEPFGGEGRTIDLETESIQDLEVITGIFNAEYGRAMSGVVNAVTKDGGNEFHGSFTGYAANYYSGHKDVFIGIDKYDINRNYDYRMNVSGPIIRNQLTFFLNTRYQDNKNHLNGVRRFSVHDYSDFASDDPDNWISEHTGDDAYVPMNDSKNWSMLGKLSYKGFNNLRLSFLYSMNDDEWNNYYHAFKYVPDGVNAAYRNSDMYALEMNHTISKSAFYELKLSYLDNFNGYYLHEDPEDSAYVHDAYLRNNEYTGFFTGGQQKDYSKRYLLDRNIKFDFTWQVNAQHNIKTGFQYINHFIDNLETQIRNNWSGRPEEEYFHINENGERIYDFYDPYVPEDSTIYSDQYIVEPYEFAAYMQDKMEFREMVINLGLRLDYFNPNTTYPSNLRNPDNSLPSEDPERRSTYPKADPKIQISPRLGLAYQLGDKAVLRFSYGHFFQMPPMYALYQNHSHQVSPTSYQTLMGNPQLNAQKTVQYEIGLWQELNTNMGLEVALYYRDIYDLLSTRIITTYNQIRYGLYSNKDYGNVKGLEFKYDVRFGSLIGNLNYTLQYTRGNADYPQQTFNRAGQSRDPVNKLIPMSWDQRHTLNVTFGYHKPNYGSSVTAYYNSGTPYTIAFIERSRLANLNLPPNNDYQPNTFTVDLTAHYSFPLFYDLKGRLTLNVYNVFDRLNDVAVNPETGKAYTAIIEPSELASHRSDFNTYPDRVHDPSMYSAPRRIKLGLGIEF